MKIFISLGSYRDSFLPITVASAYKNATYKEALVFGIVEHAYDKETFDPDAFAFKNQIRYCRIDPLYAYGAGWTRHTVQTLYNNEDYFFQIDSHTVFDPGWDARFVAEMESLRRNHARPVIGGYPSPFCVNNDNIHDIVLDKRTQCIAMVANAEASFADEVPILHITSILIDTEANGPVYAFLVAGGCLFTVGEVISEVPYDPFLYFFGDEGPISLRLWTSGYDLFHIPNLPVYSFYSRSHRTLPWDDAIEKARGEFWWLREERSRRRIRDIVTGKLSGIYGVGHTRSIEDYRQFCGIDYMNGMLENKAITGKGLFAPARRSEVETPQIELHHPIFF